MGIQDQITKRNIQVGENEFVKMKQWGVVGGLMELLGYVKSTVEPRFEILFRFNWAGSYISKPISQSHAGFTAHRAGLLLLLRRQRNRSQDGYYGGDLRNDVYPFRMAQITPALFD
ncbi:uncharacterized protein LDX57_009067 [Aspergillus melleus]|uniref:uncharacterized protein n=1 Tax=Aspergillus melleus TaxID=138277 RepID=UPI001E8EA721|nr:uncharacterized protein LDX57_009067 [Aspergillus melleus]KAH8431405.1 hypothetical protein LDX57_009067 [Aspergillus melleus]